MDRLLDLGGFQGTRNIACDSSSFQIGTSKLTHGSFSRELSKQDFFGRKEFNAFLPAGEFQVFEPTSVAMLTSVSLRFLLCLRDYFVSIVTC